MYILIKKDDIINEYNNTYHDTNKIKPDVDSSTYIDFSIQNNEKDKFNFGDHVRRSKLKHFCKRATIQKMQQMLIHQILLRRLI